LWMDVSWSAQEPRAAIDAEQPAQELVFRISFIRMLEFYSTKYTLVV
jgi:hypothetical protein